MSKSNGFKLGQHLKVSNGVYTHHGIYVGCGKIIHYAGKSHGFFDDSHSHIQITTLSDFSDGRIIYAVNESNPKFSPKVIVQRAKSRLGENHYSILSNNCEHFVNWCVHGEQSSAQVQRAGNLATAITLGSGITRVYQSTSTTSTTLSAVRLAVATTSPSSKAGLAASV